MMVASTTAFRISLAGQDFGCGNVLPAWLVLDLEVFQPCEALGDHEGLQ